MSRVNVKLKEDMKKQNLLVLLAACMLAACSSGSSEEETPVSPESPTGKMPIKLATRLSRITENSFDSGDEIGVYVVNRTNGVAGTLKSSGNHVDNMRFTYSVGGTWNPDTPIYWTDNETHADFYVYHPYSSGIARVDQLTFTARTDQSAEADYKKTDFVYGKTENVAPTTEAVNVMTSHLMSSMLITVEPGNGFTTESLAAATVKVTVNGLKTIASIDLGTGSVTAVGEAHTCTPWLSAGTYKLLVVPQVVESTRLITVNIDGKDYHLTKGFTFEKGKVYNFPVTVTKTSSGINVGVNPWEKDNEDHGGVAE